MCGNEPDDERARGQGAGQVRQGQRGRERSTAEPHGPARSVASESVRAGATAVSRGGRRSKRGLDTRHGSGEGAIGRAGAIPARVLGRGARKI